MTFHLIILAATLLVVVGVLVGCTLSDCLLDARTRRQAATQRSLNRQWQEIEIQWRELGTARREMNQRQEFPLRQPVRR